MSDTEKTMSNITVVSDKLLGAMPSDACGLDHAGNTESSTPVSRGVAHSGGARPKTGTKVYKSGEERNPMKFTLEIRVTLTPSGADPEHLHNIRGAEILPWT